MRQFELYERNGANTMKMSSDTKAEHFSSNKFILVFDYLRKIVNKKLVIIG
jgi:hypothetical protein